MKRKTQILLAQHSLLCNESYLDLLRDDMNSIDYIKCITSHTSLTTDRLYKYYLETKIKLDEFNEAKGIALKLHNAYMKKGNVYVN